MEWKYWPKAADEMMKDSIKNKASLVFALPHTAGSLSKVLSVLSFYDMNLTKIQSLPIIGREWEYMFPDTDRRWMRSGH